MRLRHIEIFNAVYAQGSVSAAAQVLHITQPTASKILKHAEDQLDYKLFQRIKGRLIPTEQAKLLYVETKKITDKVETLKTISHNLRHPVSGLIKLTAIPPLAFEHLSRAILGFQRNNPNIQFETQAAPYSSLAASIFNMDKEIGIAFNPEKTSGLCSTPLGMGEFVCIYTGNEFDHLPEKIQMSDLSNMPFINVQNSEPQASLLNHQLKERGVCLPSRITAQSFFVALNIVAMGGGIAIVDEFTARSQSAGHVKFKRFQDPVSFSVEAVWKELTPLSVQTRHFLTFFKNTILDTSRRAHNRI